MERDREEIEARGNLETESEQRMTDTNQRQLGDPLWPSLPPLTR
jgi:hypothetical protein